MSLRVAVQPDKNPAASASPTRMDLWIAGKAALISAIQTRPAHSALQQQPAACNRKPRSKARLAQDWKAALVCSRFVRKRRSMLEEGTLESAMATSSHLFETALGWVAIVWNERGVTQFFLPERDRAAMQRRLAAKAAGAAPSRSPPPAIAEIIDRVRRYCEGEAVEFSDVAVDLDGVDEFRLAIYDAARQLEIRRDHHLWRACQRAAAIRGWRARPARRSAPIRRR